MMRGPIVIGKHGKEQRKKIDCGFYHSQVLRTARLQHWQRIQAHWIPFGGIRLNHHFAAWKLPMGVLANTMFFVLF